MKRLIIALAFASLAFTQQSSAPLNDQRIMMLAQAGVSEAELLRVVERAPKIDFDLRPESADVMMKTGVSENVIKAMAARESGAAARISSTAETQPITRAKLRTTTDSRQQKL